VCKVGGEFYAIEITCCLLGATMDILVVSSLSHISLCYIMFVLICHTIMSNNGMVKETIDANVFCHLV